MENNHSYNVLLFRKCIKTFTQFALKDEFIGKHGKRKRAMFPQLVC